MPESILLCVPVALPRMNFSTKNVFFAPRQSWLAVLEKNGFPCSRESKLLARVDPATDLIEIGQYADARREQLLALTLWLAPSL